MLHYLNLILILEIELITYRSSALVLENIGPPDLHRVFDRGLSSASSFRKRSLHDDCHKTHRCGNSLYESMSEHT